VLSPRLISSASKETDTLLGLALGMEGDAHLAAGRDADAVGAYEKALCHSVINGEESDTPNLQVSSRLHRNCWVGFVSKNSNLGAIVPHAVSLTTPHTTTPNRPTGHRCSSITLSRSCTWA